MKKRTSFKQHFIREREYDSLRRLVRYKVREGTSLEKIAAQTGVHLRTLKNFYYQYSEDSALPTKSYIALLEDCGFTIEVRIIPKTNCL